MDIKTVRNMRDRHKLLFSAIFVITLLTLTWALIPLTFETNDDAYLMRLLSGGRTGKPEADTIFSLFLWGRIVSTLYAFDVGIPWYTIIFLGLIAASLITVCYCIVLSFPRWGWCLFCLLYFCMFLHYTAVLQFTLVAAFCGVAAISLLLLDKKGEKPGDFFVRNIIIFFFSFFAVNIRPESGYLALGSAVFAVCLVILGCLLKIVDREKLQKTAASFLVFCAAVGISLCVHKVHEAQNGWEDFREYYVEWARYMDYSKLDYISNKDLFDKIGWSEEFHDLLKRWFCMDETVNTETMRMLNERNMPVAVGVKESTFHTFPRIGFQIVIWVFLLFFLGIESVIRRRKIVAGDILSFLWMFMWVVETWYFAHSGRMMERAFEAWTLLAVIPSILGMGMLKKRQVNIELEESKVEDTAISVVLLMLCIVCICHPHGGYRGAKAFSQAKIQAAIASADLENYAIAHPENIYISGGSVSSEGGPWRVYTEGLPYNLLSWGGSFYNSPLYYEQLRRNGLEHMYMGDFFKENVYFIEKEKPDENLYYVMREKFPGCTYEIADEKEGFIVYHFRERSFDKQETY